MRVEWRQFRGWESIRAELYCAMSTLTFQMNVSYLNGEYLDLLRRTSSQLSGQQEVQRLTLKPSEDQSSLELFDRERKESERYHQSDQFT